MKYFKNSIYYIKPSEGNALEGRLFRLEGTSRLKSVSFGNVKAISIYGGISIVSATPVPLKST